MRKYSFDADYRNVATRLAIGVPDNDGPYIRIYVSDEGQIVFPTLQWFDEHDYDQDRFLTEERFDSEDAARSWLCDHFSRAMLEKLKHAQQK